MRGGAVIGVVAVVALVGSACSAAGRAPAPTPEGEAMLVVDALKRGDVDSATARVEDVVDGSSGPVRGDALLLGAVIYLHPRNSHRNPDRAAELAARYVGQSLVPRERELGLALYEIALEMGARPRPDAAGGALPQVPQDERTSLERVKQLERQIERLQRELARIRATLQQ